MSFDKKEYIYDSYKDKFRTKVTSCKLNDNQQFEVILDKTIFYPDMLGGQPKDNGTINGLKVLDVYEKDEEVIHILDNYVEGEVLLKIDFDKRFDHMQQHTGQHLLSCSFAHLFNAKTIGFHLSGEYTTIDLDVDFFTNDMIKDVEFYANQIIYDNLKVETKILSHEDAMKTGLRKQPVDDKLIRVVKIGEKDNVACCGTHVNFTGEIGIVKIVKYEKYKSGTRVEFLCGKRALIDYINKNLDINKLANSFSCHNTKLVENIEKHRLENSVALKKINSLQNKLYDYKAKEYIDNAKVLGNIKYIFVQNKDNDIKEDRMIISKIIENDNFLCGFVIKNGNNLNLIIAQSLNLNLDIKSVFKECSSLVGLKGGGNNRMIQGTSKSSDKFDELFKMLCKIYTM
ncbi:metal-dependent hydrolase [Sedimentibacter sp. zth1]|uniref:alanyl-tRNA editing protein n=1 Tax=Sedimentibacter sp. zth1 TaxID=2816908 RepID=UPI001A936B53|nr:DHHA1 domain-containing protein [Sedimentibacter sp. zth1]QSX06948.1 metal-dependent hydrolase [Sedimentibacter sp. zth1]